MEWLFFAALLWLAFFSVGVCKKKAGELFFSLLIWARKFFPKI